MAAEQNVLSEDRKICRICLRIDPRALDMFNSYYEERDTLYCDMLVYCSKVLVSMQILSKKIKKYHSASTY